MKVDNGYLCIKNFIDKKRAKSLHNEFYDFSKKNNLTGDPQAENSYCYYNYLPFLELLCEKTNEVTELIGETVLPTYNYARVYLKNSVLIPHRDRLACEISLTLHLDGDKNWPFYLYDKEGNKKSIDLESGDAVLYLGAEITHGRDLYNGNYYSQAFFHYVLSRGKNKKYYFDSGRKVK